MDEKNKPLTDRTIPGITWKQVVAYTAAIVTVLFFYFRIEAFAKEGLKQSIVNGDILKTVVADIKTMATERTELIRINNLKIQSIELDIRELRIRIDNLEQKNK